MTQQSTHTAHVFIILISVGILILCVAFTFEHEEIYNKLNIVEYSRKQTDNIQRKVIEKETINNSVLSERIIPSTWEDLNTQQFCRIEQSNTYSKQMKYLQFLYKLQFPINCFANDSKFLIYDIYLEKGSGLGASLFGSMFRYFTASLILNRTFLLNGTFDWSELAHYCRHKNAMECYFLPLSNCNPLNILNKNIYNNNTYYEGNGFGPYGNGLLKKCNNSYCVSQYKIIYINKHSSHRPVMRRGISKFAQSNWKMTWSEFAAVSVSFMLRPQPNVRKIIFDKIAKSINKSIGINNNYKININGTISLPIRASDKCKNINSITGKKYTHGAEIDCFTPIEYVYLMNSIKYLTDKIPNNKIENIILTSEDISFINDVIKYMKNKTYSNVRNWNIILNTEDYSVGEGTTTFQKTVKRFGKEFETFSKTEIFTSFYTDHIISAISSIILQIHLDNKYFIVLGSSTWTKLMWNWMNNLNCNIQNPNKHIMKNKKCISLIVPGYQTRGLKYKYVKFSKDLWQQIHNEDLNPDKFEKKFNIKIGDDGWNNYCNGNA